MHNSTALRSLAIYGICLPLAIFLGYLLAGPLTWTSLTTVVVVFAILVSPLFLKFHHPLLVLGWNAVITAFFFPGSPKIWLPLMGISLGVSIVRRSMDRSFRFLSVPSVSAPLIFMAVVVLVTAKATGGIGVKAFGSSDVIGGKRYIFLLGAIAGYFALTAQAIPKEKANLYMRMFLLGGMTVIVSDIFYFRAESLHFLALLFPPSGYVWGGVTGEGVRFAGINLGASVVVFYLMARYGIRSIFSIESPMRLFIFVVCCFASLLGGFRSSLINLAMLFCVQFCLEGLHRTRLLPVLFLAGILAATVCLPFVNQLPFGIQRTLSFLPVDVDPRIRMDAEGSTDWRLQIWQAVLPQIPRYFWLGKGLAMTAQDFDYTVSNAQGNIKAFSEDQSWAALSGDYHSGPLSTIIPFGIWGVIAFIWFIVAGTRVLYMNYRYGDPDLRIMNSFLLATFITKIISFLFIFGGLYADMQAFVGYLAMGICLNGGVARAVVEPVTQKVVPFRSFGSGPHRLPA